MQASHWTWSHELLQVWCSSLGLGYRSTCLEDVGIDRSPNTGFLENCSGSRWNHSQRITAVSHRTKLWQGWLREEILPQRHFKNRFLSTAVQCRNHHSSHSLLHGDPEIDENLAGVGLDSKPVPGSIRSKRSCWRYTRRQQIGWQVYSECFTNEAGTIDITGSGLENISCLGKSFFRGNIGHVVGGHGRYASSQHRIGKTLTAWCCWTGRRSVMVIRLWQPAESIERTCEHMR